MQVVMWWMMVVVQSQNKEIVSSAKGRPSYLKTSKDLTLFA